ncbi:uncharacterized protein [Dermacentor andersoni]|uniref:uncharacterized protein isoform X2 n=1 Tax=Dermacentor andersoni TaxID=34620 RepID=UPI002416B889|nr:uncharacterized protein LOC129385171 isoform X2 [Dermacentor andersoni]
MNKRRKAGAAHRRLRGAPGTATCNSTCNSGASDRRGFKTVRLRSHRVAFMALLLRAACASLSLFLCCAVPLALSPSKYAGSMTARTLYNGSVHREKRQLSEIVYALTSGARLIIGAGVGLLQSIGRIGKDVVGESDGGLLGLLSSLFTGVNVSLGFRKLL